MMKGMLRLILILFSLMSLTQAAVAQEKEKKDYSNEPWERAGLYLGAFIIDADSSLDLGLNVGNIKIKVDGEDVLGLKENYTVFRADAFWRITRRNRVDFTFYEMDRGGSGVSIFDDVDFPSGNKIETDLDMTILRGSYAWSFFKNEHFDLGIAGGVYTLGLDFKMQTDTGNRIQRTDFTAPLPVIGLRGNFALTPKWFIRQTFDYFYINYGNYEGQLIDFFVALEWNALKYLGLGVGYNAISMDLDYEGSDNFLSNIDMSYGGVLLFGKIYF
jgi:hypothetical protein